MTKQIIEEETASETSLLDDSPKKKTSLLDANYLGQFWYGRSYNSILDASSQ